mmetsp:Transcript_88165/g.172478  ORF Transcript_88165/g.172478 Transcript_88165/m.172478 type:complete len:332 (+) Transcript_88165:58-1053(+)
MRFKAKLTADQVSVLCNVVAPMSKLQDSHRGAVLYLDPDFIRISCRSDSGITCFAELSKLIFLEHRIESAAENVIVCQVDLMSLKLALQSVISSGSHIHGNNNNNNNNNSNSRRGNQPNTNSQHQPPPTMVHALLAQQTVVLKLAKRNRLPCLCLDGHATDEGAVEIHQAIPIRIMRATEMQYHLPPQINTPSVQLELSMDRPLRVVVDKLKSMGPHIFLEASMKGDLTIRLDHDGASLACFYHNLQPRWEEPDDNDEPTITINSSCILKVDGTKLAQCLQWQQSHIATSSCLIAMVHNEMLVLHVMLHPEQFGFFTYYLPVYCLTEEDLQ